MNAKEVREAIKKRFSPPDWLFAEELELVPCSRADAVALNVTGFGHLGRAFLGFEIKISRADYLHEIKNPDKRAAAYMGCDAVFICCPSKMIDPRELPDDLGLLEVRGGGSTRIKRYPVGWVAPLEKVTRPETVTNKLWTHTYPTVHIDELPAIPRVVAGAFARSFNPNHKNLSNEFKISNLERSRDEYKTKLKYAKGEVKDEFIKYCYKKLGKDYWGTRQIIADTFVV
jgi:hypothetical protein